MERAGAGVARACLDLLGGAYGRRAVVVCGKGNNGGDGLVAARHLARAGVRVVVLLDWGPISTSRRPATSPGSGVRPTHGCVRFDPAVLRHELARADLAVDAIFGTGFRGAPEDEWADAIEIAERGGLQRRRGRHRERRRRGHRRSRGRRGPSRPHGDVRRGEARLGVAARRRVRGRRARGRHRVRRARAAGGRRAHRPGRRGGGAARAPDRRPQEGQRHAPGGRGLARR